MNILDPAPWREQGIDDLRLAVTDLNTAVEECFTALESVASDDPATEKEALS